MTMDDTSEYTIGRNRYNQRKDQQEGTIHDASVQTNNNHKYIDKNGIICISCQTL